MQKKLIALAIAAAFSAPAMADVTMYGIVDAAVANLSGANLKSDTIAASGGLSGSRLGAKAAEDLDNGMKAVVVLEYALDTQQADGVGAARQEMLAVAGGFGTVATGYLQTTGYDWAVKFDPTSGSTVSPLQNVTKGRFLVGTAAVAARAPRAIAYISPDMGGVTVAVNHSTSLVGATAANLGNLATATNSANVTTNATLLSATYTGVANLVVGGVYATTSGTNGTFAANTTDVALGASYDLGVVKLMGTYQTTKTSVANAQTDKALSFTAVAPVGPGAAVFTYAKNTIASTAATADNGNGMTLAWLQGLSKTTTLYAAYSKMSQDSATNAYSVYGNALGGGSLAQGAAVAGNTALTNGGSSTMIAVGLKKSF